VDLGPLTPCLPARLATRSRRISLAPPRLLDDLKRLAAHGPSEHGGLSLIGRRDVRSNNSWMHNAERLVKGRDRCTLHMHPDDAKARGLVTGQRVRVTRACRGRWSHAPRHGRRPAGVVLPHGWGHGRDGTRLRVANAVPGVSISDLTDDLLVDQFCGNAQFSRSRSRSPADRVAISAGLARRLDRGRRTRGYGLRAAPFPLTWGPRGATRNGRAVARTFFTFADPFLLC
jgi:hypothetical protein